MGNAWFGIVFTRPRDLAEHAGKVVQWMPPRSERLGRRLQLPHAHVSERGERLGDVPVNSVARGLQFQHYDGRQLTIHGKAGKIRLLPVVDEDLRLELERHILERRPSPEEYLLYPEKLGPEFYGGPVGVIWENRTSEPSPTAMHRWWTRRLEVAGLPHRPMHEARHTAITEFLRDTGNLKLAQMLAGHVDIGTTANIYAHLDTSDLETALRRRNRR